MIKGILTHDQARAAALGYARGLLARGYTSADAAGETCMGFSGPDGPGWDIRHGKMIVPMFGPGKHTFRFAELEAEIRRGQATEQLTLF